MAQALLNTIKEWPKDLYDLGAVIVAVRAELDKSASTSSINSSTPDATVLMECLSELYVSIFSMFFLSCG